MPTYNNELERPHHLEGTILEKATGKTIGTIRVKPSRILWKPKGQTKYYNVSLDKFVDWIQDKKTGASRTAS